MRAAGYVVVGSRTYAPGEKLPDGLDNVTPAGKDEAVPEAPATVPAENAGEAADPNAAGAPVVEGSGDAGEQEGAAAPGTAPAALPTTKKELVALAEKLGLDTTGTNKVLAARIAAAQAE